MHQAGETAFLTSVTPYCLQESHWRKSSVWARRLARWIATHNAVGGNSFVGWHQISIYLNVDLVLQKVGWSTSVRALTPQPHFIMAPSESIFPNRVASCCTLTLVSGCVWWSESWHMRAYLIARMSNFFLIAA